MLRAHRERCLSDEPGTRTFDILSVNDDDRKLMLYEVYDSEAAFQVHWEGASVQQLRTDAEGMEFKLAGVCCTNTN